MGLEQGDTGLRIKRGGKRRERVVPDKLQKGRFKILFCRKQEPLPFRHVLFELFLPAIKRADRDFVGFTDPLCRPEAQGVLRQDAQDEKETVVAVWDDRIRQYSVGGRMTALPADETADTKILLYGPSSDNLNQSAAVVGMDFHHALASAARACLCFRAKSGTAFLKNRFSGSFFPGKLAIDQVLPYHNSA